MLKKIQSDDQCIYFENSFKIIPIKDAYQKANCFNEKEKPIRRRRTKKHDEFLIQWLISDFQPFIFVDNHHFKEFISFFCSCYCYVIPDRHKVKGKHIIEI